MFAAIVGSSLLPSGGVARMIQPWHETAASPRPPIPLGGTNLSSTRAPTLIGSLARNNIPERLTFCVSPSSHASSSLVRKRRLVRTGNRWARCAPASVLFSLCMLIYSNARHPFLSRERQASFLRIRAASYAKDNTAIRDTNGPRVAFRWHKGAAGTTCPLTRAILLRADRRASSAWEHAACRMHR